MALKIRAIVGGINRESQFVLNIALLMFDANIIKYRDSIHMRRRSPLSSLIRLIIASKGR